MKTLLIVLTSLILYSIPSTGAADTLRPGPYVSVFVGASISNDTSVSSYDYYYNAPFSDNVSFDPGVYSGFTGGYDFGYLRMEGELSYRYNEIKSVSEQFSGLTMHNVSGNVGAFATMLNMFIDIHNTSPITPYLGGGIGFVNLELSDTTGNGLLLYGSGNATVMAYQVGGGVNIALNRRLSLDLGYRYFMTDTADFDSYYPISSSFKLDSHNVSVGCRFKF
jgi:opacity protein-like surface antigen